MKPIFLKRISEFFTSREKDIGQQPKLFFNEKQRYILIGVMILIMGMLLYAPYRLEYQGMVVARGYAWIFNLPRSYVTATVDIGLLFAQWIGILLVGAIGFLLFKEK